MRVSLSPTRRKTSILAVVQPRQPADRPPARRLSRGGRPLFGGPVVARFGWRGDAAPPCFPHAPRPPADSPLRRNAPARPRPRAAQWLCAVPRLQAPADWTRVPMELSAPGIHPKEPPEAPEAHKTLAYAIASYPFLTKKIAPEGAIFRQALAQGRP